ncbi:MAG: thioredoxin domain-containing protein [Niabella sp.]
MPNSLINETSPYLLQHAHNPVNWYPWGTEALQKAVEEDKPILVSIGYAACHWCHVMERESFEDAGTAALMNEHFINIKIDREERPDLDHIYMDAVQAMGGSGGWPLNVFLTPSKKPFYGGTYFPPKAAVNRPSWIDVLTAVADAFQNKRADIEQQANGLTEHLFQSNNFGIGAASGTFSTEQIDAACGHLLQQADKQWGGFGGAPKFPQTFSIQFLLKYSRLERKRNKYLADEALQQALLSLDKMIHGGIYDQIGGGFTRYSTDREWLAPHFEKMLYDNALLVIVLSEAFQITRNEIYKQIIEQTLAFTEREMLDPSNGFYAALDADSEGVEGKFYVWEYHEVKNILGPDADLYCAYYDITTGGNWEHTNILRIKEPLALFAEKREIDVGNFAQFIKDCNNKLLIERSKRVRPSLDDKVLLGWNALMNTAYSKAYAATGHPHYKSVAITNMQFILNSFSNSTGLLNHVWKNGQAKYPAFLDDYAYLVQALLELYKITAETTYLQKANVYCKAVIEHFSEPEGYFYYTPKGQEDVIVRKKEVYDGAIPSGNAVMAQNLMALGILFDNTEWLQRAQSMIVGLSNVAIKYPTSFGIWLNGLYQIISGTKEIVLIGDYEKALQQLMREPQPFSIIMAAEKADDTYPLLKDRNTDQALAIFLCENYTCKKPVHSIEELLYQLN